MGLDAIELILEAEKRFGVSVPDERTEKTETVEKFAQLLFELRAQTSAPLSYEEVLLQLREIIAKIFRIPIERIVPEAHFIKDLGLN